MIPSLANLYEAAFEIRLLLMPFAFVLCVIGIGEAGWRAGSDTRAILGVLLKMILVVSLLAGYPAAMEGGQKAFVELRSKFSNARSAKFVQLLNSRIENQPSDSWTDLGKVVPAAIGMFFQGIGRFMLIVLRFFQDFAIAGLIAVSPLLLGFLFLSHTQSLGIQFGITSLTVLLWHVAICLVDIVIVAISDTLFVPITTGGLTQVTQNLFTVHNWLLFPFVMAFAAIITVFFYLFFYLSVPFVAGAIMKGASGTTSALQAGIQGSMQAAGMAVGAGLTAAGAAATMGGSAAVQGAMAGTEAATGAATAAGRIAADVAGAAGGSFSSGSGDVPPPPPVPSGSSGGGSVASADNPGMVAHQTAPNAFAVVDNDRGTVSHHPGSIATPHATQAAFNSHAAKAQPLPQNSPLANRTN